jgi:hypothetical protein
MVFGSAAHAQLSHAELCRVQTLELTVSKKTAVGLKQPRAVALEQAGLKAHGPRFALASLAHSRFESAATEAELGGEFCAQ